MILASTKVEEKKKDKESDNDSSGDEWRDHKVKLSYLLNDEDGQRYPCLSKRFRTEPSSRVYEADERHGGKLVHVKRNVFVAPYELVEMAIATPRHSWYIRLTYKEHNVIRRRATRDDTWPEMQWLDKVLAAVQDPVGHPRMHFYLREKPNRLGTGHDFELEIKEKNNGKVVKYINPATMRLVPSGHWETLSEKEKQLVFGKHTVLPPSSQRFFEEVYAINHDAFTRLCKTGELEKLKALYKLGYVEPKTFCGDGDRAGQGWCPLQYAAYNGRKRTVVWLLDDVKVPYDARSADGWTAFHCACLKGHFEVAKILHARGASIFDETRAGGGGMTPMILMMENNHAGMVRYFMGEDSKYAKECYEGHGLRSTFIPPDMYNVLKPLPDDIMAEIAEAQKKKIAAIEQRKNDEYYAANPDALRKLGQSTRKGARGGSRASSSRSPSRSSSKPGTAQSRKGGKK